MMSPLVAAIIVAGGSGERFGQADGKQIAVVADRPVLSWSVLALDASGVDAIVVVCDPARVDEYRTAAVDPLTLRAPVTLVAGGATRQGSVASGVRAMPEATDIVVVHDGARPLVTPDVVRGAIDALVRAPDVDGVVVAHPLVDTVKIVEGARVVSTPDRSSMWAVQTPQVFRAETLRSALDSAAADAFIGTDDASLVERFGGLVQVYEGPRDNIKLTVPEDGTVVDALLRRRRAEGGR